VEHRCRPAIRAIDSIAGYIADVALKPAGALDHQVDRREVGDQDVEIEVKRLLHHLGGDEHLAAPPLGVAGRTEAIDDTPFNVESVTETEACMK